MIEQKDNDELTTAYLAGCYDMKKAYEQRLAEAEAKIPRWIPVGQLLPQKNEFVLFIDGKDTLGGCEKVYVDKIVDSGRGRDCLKNYLHNYTHWMPLPEVPESGSEGE
ncbi:MAG: DUF551 domain-containing protein [Hahellaceae bacterium]|nr:DUF551 domain-containing protein [Hahellaceae bacterium]